MPPFHKLEPQVVGSASFREYEASEKNPFLEMMPGVSRVEAAVVRRASEPRVIARSREKNENVRMTASESDCPRRKIESVGSGRSAEARSWQNNSSSKTSASLRSLVRRRARRHGASSLPREVEAASSYSSQPSCYPLEKESGASCRSEETCNTTTPTSTLLYGSAVQASSSKGENHGYDASSSTSNVIGAVSTKNIASIVSANRFAINNATSSTVRTTSVVAAAAGPSTPPWANSIGPESDYVVDPVEGNVYHKGLILGMGGFARVFLITDVSNGKQYACKIIPKKRMHTDHMRKIAREIMIHKPLNHVNVVQMHHYFQDSLNVYMLLEACPRKSLKHVLKLRGKVTEPEARYYMKQMVTGVAYIHSQKVVHRDLKPDNMFLSNGMIVKIGDFGLATRPDGQRRPVTICGTPNYIAPEVLYEKAYSYEADVWALGCILYALLVGQPPFDSSTLKETYARIRSNTYREVDDTMACRNGQDLIKWLLQPNPEHRPTLDRVKEHAYLTKEHVPASLPHTCCYQMPHSAIVEPHSSSPTTVSTASRRRKSRKAQVWQEVVPQDAKHRQQQSISAQHIQQNSQQHRLQAVAAAPAQQQQSSNRSQKSTRKQSKVINWLVRLFRRRLNSVPCCYCPDKKSGALPQSAQMYRALAACITEMKSNNALENPTPAKDVVPLFITKWMDYSNKYGLVFQLSDKSVGVLFNDNTKISYTHDRRVEYMTTEDEVTRYDREKDVPAVLQEKLKLLQRFTQYMDDFITEGGEIKERRTVTKQSKNICVPRMRRWLLIEKTMVMELTIPLVQVNFVDHTKMVVAHEPLSKGYLLTYIDMNKCTSSYWLKDIREHGCTAELYERLYYLCNVTREFAELDNAAMA